MSEVIGLRENIISIICEWKERAEKGAGSRFLEARTIHEHLEDRGIEVPEKDLGSELMQLSRTRQISLTLADTVSEMSVQDVNQELCKHTGRGRRGPGGGYWI